MLNLEDPKKVSNYETDLFWPLIERAAELCKLEVSVPLRPGLHCLIPRKSFQTPN